MNEYTYCSIDPDNYNVIQCPVNYQGASEQVTWTVSGLMSFCNIVVLDTDDFIEFEIPNLEMDEEDEQVVRLTVTTLHKTIDAAVISSLTEGVKTLTHESVVFMKTDEGFCQFVAPTNNDFKIMNMSYRMKLALGFYYVEHFPLRGDYHQGHDNIAITAKAIGYNLSTPMWYVVSNLGSPNSISQQFNPYTSSNPAVVMRIMNSFVNEQPLSYNNSEFVTTSQASSLSNIRCEIVDANLEPIRFLNPVYLTISVKAISPEERQPKEEALAEQPANKEQQMAMQQKQLDNMERMMMNTQKISDGVTVEPDHKPFFKVEVLELPPEP